MALFPPAKAFDWTPSPSRPVCGSRAMMEKVPRSSEPISWDEANGELTSKASRIPNPIFVLELLVRIIIIDPLLLGEPRVGDREEQPVFDA